MSKSFIYLARRSLPYSKYIIVTLALVKSLARVRRGGCLCRRLIENIGSGFLLTLEIGLGDLFTTTENVATNGCLKGLGSVQPYDEVQVHFK